MKRISSPPIAVGFSFLVALGCAPSNAVDESPEVRTETEAEAAKFKVAAAGDWREVFYDSGTEDWNQHWSLDGLKAEITHDERGMNFAAGPTLRNDADHAVLWTKESFAGDIRIDYEYTKTDDMIQAVTILYVQATGSGETPYAKDISTWRDLREVPAMKTYFNHMHTYHISYAAFDTTNEVPGEDYIRARRYRPDLKQGLEGTALSAEYFRTGLLGQGVPHQITVIKRGSDLYMHIRNAERELRCHWTTGAFPAIAEGRIGLRHMWGRSARYRDFRVSVPAK